MVNAETKTCRRGRQDGLRVIYRVLSSGATLRFASVLLATSFLMTACEGGAEGELGPGGPGPGVGAGMGPGISVREALASQLEGPLLVNGWLWRTNGGDLRLCTGLTDSIPPRCTQPWLTVKGLDLSAVDGLRTENGVTWSPQPIQVLGTITDGVLEVSGLSQG